MPSLLERLSADLKDAMRAGDATRRDEIRGLLAMLKTEQQSKLTRTLNADNLIPDDSDDGQPVELTPEQEAAIERARATSQLTDDEQQGVLLLRVKQHRQSIDSFRKGKRADLLEVEEAQLAVLEAYLPQQLDAAGIEAAIQAALAETGASTPRDTGKVMQLLSSRLRGQADMKAVAARVQALLAGTAT